MLSIKKLSVATVVAILSFTTEAAAEYTGTTDFSVRADSAETAIQDGFVLRWVDRATLTNAETRDVDNMDRRDFVEELKVRGLRPSGRPGILPSAPGRPMAGRGLKTGSGRSRRRGL